MRLSCLLFSISVVDKLKRVAKRTEAPISKKKKFQIYKMPQKNPHQWKLRFFNYKIPSTDAKARTASVQGVILYTVSLGSAVPATNFFDYPHFIGILSTESKARLIILSCIKLNNTKEITSDLNSFYLKGHTFLDFIHRLKIRNSTRKCCSTASLRDLRRLQRLTSLVERTKGRTTEQCSQT